MSNRTPDQTPIPGGPERAISPNGTLVTQTGRAKPQISSRRPGGFVPDADAYFSPNTTPEDAYLEAKYVVHMANPEDALGEDGNFDSGRWQRYKASTLSVVRESAKQVVKGAENAEKGVKLGVKGTKESAKFVKQHRTAQAALALVALTGIFSQIIVEDSHSTGGNESGHHLIINSPSPDAGPDNQPFVGPVAPPVLPQETAPKLDGITVRTRDLSENLTVKLIDLVGANIDPSVPLAEQPKANDMAIDIKIVHAENQQWSTFDWSQAIAFKGIGIDLFDGNNPLLNGEQRWQLTTLLAKSMGVDPSELNKVYFGDEFKGIKITSEIVKFIQDQNVQIPDSILKTAGLASLPVSNDKPIDDVTTGATVVPETASSGEVKTASGTEASMEVNTDSIGNIDGGSVAAPVSAEDLKYTVGEFYFESAQNNEDGTSRITIVPESLDYKVVLNVSQENAKILIDDENGGSAVKIDVFEADNKINYVYRRTGNEIRLYSESTPAYAAALKAQEDAKKAEEESFWEYYQILVLLGVVTSAAGLGLMIKGKRGLGASLFSFGALGIPGAIATVEAQSLPVYPVAGSLAVAFAALAVAALKIRDVKIADDDEEGTLRAETVIGRASTTTH